MKNPKVDEAYLKRLGLIDEAGMTNELGTEVTAELLPRFPPRKHGRAFPEIKRAAGCAVACELAIDNYAGAVLLAYRIDPNGFDPYTGWHFPGRQHVGDNAFCETVQECAREEVGTEVRILQPQHKNPFIPFMGTIDHTGKEYPVQFHQTSLIFHCHLDGTITKPVIVDKEPRDGDLRWFRACPKGMIRAQWQYWDVLKHEGIV